MLYANDPGAQWLIIVVQCVAVGEWNAGALDVNDQ